tara:strand:- start:975 stop:1316 length:342 start_codon:yes stop_codon:yes gene_type:complete
MENIFDKNYSNQNLVISSQIWNDKKVNGMQKQLLALIEKLTRKGERQIDMMTKHMANINSTHLKDIEYNLEQLNKKGFISVKTNPLSKTGLSIVYLYNTNTPETPSNGTSGLF